MENNGKQEKPKMNKDRNRQHINEKNDADDFSRNV